MGRSTGSSPRAAGCQGGRTVACPASAVPDGSRANAPPLGDRRPHAAGLGRYPSRLRPTRVAGRGAQVARRDPRTGHDAADRSGCRPGRCGPGGRRTLARAKPERRLRHIRQTARLDPDRRSSLRGGRAGRPRSGRRPSITHLPGRRYLSGQTRVRHRPPAFSLRWCHAGARSRRRYVGGYGCAGRNRLRRRSSNRRDHQCFCTVTRQGRSRRNSKISDLAAGSSSIGAWPTPGTST